MTPSEVFALDLQLIGEQASAALRELYERLDPPALYREAAKLLMAWELDGTAYGWRWWTDVIIDRTGAPLYVGPAVPAADAAAKAAAVAAIVPAAGGTDTAVMQLDRLARSLVAKAAQREVLHQTRVGAERGYVRGWRRDVEPGGCQLCRWWSRDGRVWPAEHTMPTHPGCRCTPTPVLTRQAIKSVDARPSTAHWNRIQGGETA